MRQTGRQSLLYKVRKFDTLGTDRELATRVLHILEPYTVEQVSSASAGAGTFYNWVGQILSNFLYRLPVHCMFIYRYHMHFYSRIKFSVFKKILQTYFSLQAKNIATEVNGRKQGKAKPSKTKKK